MNNVKLYKFFFFFLLISLFCIPSYVFSSEKVGIISSINGAAVITRDNKTFDAKMDDPIYEFDTIETLENSRLKLHFSDDSIISLTENSRLVVQKYSSSEGSKKDISILELLSGKLLAVSGRSSLEVHTPTAMAAARGTKFYVWMFDKESGVAVLLGKVEFWIQEHPDWREIIDEGFMGFSRNNEQPESPSPITPRLLRELEKIEEAIDNDNDNGNSNDNNADDQCGKCEVLDDENNCVPDNTIDPGPCQKCSNGIPVADNSEDPGMCLRCNNGNAVPDNSEDPGTCLTCNGGKIKPDNSEDPGLCKKCSNGSPISDNSEDPGTCLKCSGGNSVSDDLEDPGLCKKCSGGSAVPDNSEDPGQCRKCSGGNTVPDDFEDPGICYKCSAGNSVPDNFEPCSDGDICSINDRCQGGRCTGDIDPSPIDPNCI